MILIIQCSQLKSDLLKGAAKDIYRGQLMILGLQYAEKFNLTPYILSGLYGIIKPDTEIQNYDKRLSTAYRGPWPEGEGWWLGGKQYFAKAPDRIQPLIPNNLGYGDMKNWLGTRLGIGK